MLQKIEIELLPVLVPELGEIIIEIRILLFMKNSVLFNFN